jgi:hypothetical protein
MSAGSVRGLTGRMPASMLSWIVTVAGFVLILTVIVAHAEPCSGSTEQQVAAIARMGAQPGLMTFFCGECGMADSIWLLAPIAPSDEITPVRAVTEPRAR